MVTERFPAQDVYDQAAKDITEFLEAGQDVVVLCEGDPLFLWLLYVSLWAHDGTV